MSNVISVNRSCEKEVMGLQFFCAENSVNDWINFWKRQRLVWWRKFANVRSNFSLYEEQSNLEPGVNSQTFVQVWFRYYPFIMNFVIFVI